MLLYDFGGIMTSLRTWGPVCCIFLPWQVIWASHYVTIFTSIFVQPLHIGHTIIGLYRAAHETGQFQVPMPKAQDNKPKKDRQ